ncbi:MAG TPA: hypothetical protein VGA78_00205 [Gemmatimonadales bacterium]
MTTRLDKTLKRELDIEGKPYTIAISPEGVKITPKGGRKGQEVSWRDIMTGSPELLRDLTGSIQSGGGAQDEE